MTRRHTTTRGQADRDEPARIEWIGGTFAVPGEDDEDEANASEGLCWIDGDGVILNTAIAKAGELPSIACTSLQHAIEEPIFGEPCAPTQLRVASPELAEVLRAGYPELDIVCAPTPELEIPLTPLLRAVCEALREERLVAPTYLAPGVTPDAVAALFRAAASLSGAQASDLALNGERLFAVTVEQLGVQGAIVSVFGHEDEISNVTVFPSVDDFYMYLDATDVIELDGVPELPSHLVLSFEQREALAPELLSEIAEHGWEISGRATYPHLAAIEPPRTGRLPHAKEVALAEVIALAFTAALDDPDTADAVGELGAAWTSGERATRTLSVHSHQGEVAVTLATPEIGRPIEPDQQQGLLAALAALAAGEPDIDWDAREPLVEALMRRFASSPEAQDLAEVTACYHFMNIAASCLGACLATIGPLELRHLLFDLIPRDVSFDPSEAEQILEELHAFYSFLRREFQLKPAEACLRVLGPNAVYKLEAALAEHKKFGVEAAPRPKQKRKRARRARKRSR